MSQQFAFDALHRLTQTTNVLGSFTNTFVSDSQLIATNFAPFGKKAIYSYLSITNDERLAGIWNQNVNGANLSQFSYGYDSVGNITNWTEQASNNAPTVAVMQYDPVNQLLNSTTFSNTVAGMVLKQFAYSYDLAGNRTSEQIGSTAGAPVAVSESGYDSGNQVTNRTSNSGPVMFAGNISRPGTVSVAGTSATMYQASNFVGYANATVGTNVVPVAATDYGGHSGTNNYLVVVTNNGVAESMMYDANGNMTNLVTATSTNSYQWDAANRLVAITQVTPTNVEVSLFSYDGVGRRVQDIEATNGVAYLTNKFIWDGQALVEQRGNAGTNLVRRFFAQGEQISGTNYYFTTDHLGSIREVVNGAGVVESRYDYDPFGRQVLITGAAIGDFGYAGMYYHTISSLSLTLYRAYSADLGRWISRDPLSEFGGINLYAYVANSLMNLVDPLGLCPIDPVLYPLTPLNDPNSLLYDPLTDPNNLLSPLFTPLQPSNALPSQANNINLTPIQGPMFTGGLAGWFENGYNNWSHPIQNSNQSFTPPTSFSNPTASYDFTDTNWGWPTYSTSSFGFSLGYQRSGRDAGGHGVVYWRLNF